MLHHLSERLRKHLGLEAGKEVWSSSERLHINALNKCFPAKERWDPNRLERLKSKNPKLYFPDECKSAWNVVLNCKIAQGGAKDVASILTDLEPVPYLKSLIENIRKARLDAFDVAANQAAKARLEAAGAAESLRAAEHSAAAAQQAAEAAGEQAESSLTPAEPLQLAQESIAPASEEELAPQPALPASDINKSFAELSVPAEFGGQGGGAEQMDEEKEVGEPPQKKKETRRRNKKLSERALLTEQMTQRAQERSKQAQSLYQFALGDVLNGDDNSEWRKQLAEVARVLSHDESKPNIIFFDPPQSSSHRGSCFEKAFSDEQLQQAASNLVGLLADNGTLFCICTSEQFAIMFCHLRQTHSGECMVDPAPLVVIPHHSQLPKGNQKSKSQMEATSVTCWNRCFTLAAASLMLIRSAAHCCFH